MNIPRLSALALATLLNATAHAAGATPATQPAESSPSAAAKQGLAVQLVFHPTDAKLASRPETSEPATLVLPEGGAAVAYKKTRPMGYRLLSCSPENGQKIFDLARVPVGLQVEARLIRRTPDLAYVDITAEYTESETVHTIEAEGCKMDQLGTLSWKSQGRHAMPLNGESISVYLNGAGELTLRVPAP